MEGWVKVNLPDPSESFRFSECSICQFYHAAPIFQSANSGTTRLWKLKQLDVISGLSTDCIISIIAASNQVRFCDLLTFGRSWFWCSLTFGSSNWLPGPMSNEIWLRPAPTPLIWAMTSWSFFRMIDKLRQTYWRCTYKILEHSVLLLALSLTLSVSLISSLWLSLTACGILWLSSALWAFAWYVAAWQDRQ